MFKPRTYKPFDFVNLIPPSKSLHKDRVLAEYQHIFTGIDLFPGEVKIEVDPTKQPVNYPPRMVLQFMSKTFKVE